MVLMFAIFPGGAIVLGEQGDQNDFQSGGA